LSHVLGHVADFRMPSALLRPVISAYSFALGVETGEMVEPEGGFESFGDFFVRRLRPDVRPICGDRDALICPADGLVVDQGAVDDAAGTTIEIKGVHYDVGQLIGGAADQEDFSGGGYLVIYLHPRDYHRVHSPVDGELAGVCHVPGKLFPVASWSERRVKGIYGKNERMVYVLMPTCGGTLVVVMVAAFGVGNIDTPFAPIGRAGNGESTTRCFEPRIDLRRGDDLGAFRLGSTVVMIWTRGAFEVDPGPGESRVVMGSRIGRLGAPAGGAGSGESE
jgi:phosphatidylserine decarboxylase